MNTRDVASTAFAFVGATLMIFYGVGKVHDPEWLQRLGIVNQFPLLETPIGHWLPWFEIALGILILAGGKTGRGAMVATAMLLFAFLPVLVFFLLSGAVDCGCGGGGEPTILNHPAVGIVRNILVGTGLLWGAKIQNTSFDRPGEKGHNSI